MRVLYVRDGFGHACATAVLLAHRTKHDIAGNFVHLNQLRSRSSPAAGSVFEAIDRPAMKSLPQHVTIRRVGQAKPGVGHSRGIGGAITTVFHTLVAQR